MTKEELKEMIDSTIAANGERAITGQALNLALNAIIDSMGTGGSGARRLYVPLGDDDEEELASAALASNAMLYTEIKAALESGEPCPVTYLAAEDRGATVYTTSTAYIMGNVSPTGDGDDGDNDGADAVVAFYGIGLQIALMPDGSVSVEDEYSLNSLSHAK